MQVIAMMRRRRRGQREIAFSLDSFLDVITNVVGIIIRMIVVVSVGARAYHAVQVRPRHPPSRSVPNIEKKITDPLRDEIAQQQRELHKAQDQLLEQLRQLPKIEAEAQKVRQQIQLTSLAKDSLMTDERKLNQSLIGTQKAGEHRSLTLAELQRRGEKLREAIVAMQKLPAPTKAIHYRAPVSRPVQMEELYFECQQGRVCFVDLTAFINEIRDGLDRKVDVLRRQWQLEDVTQPIGAFRLRYVLERDRGSMDALAGGGLEPSTSTGFRYGLSEWKVEPIALQRGEDQTAALHPRSEFRQIVDHVDPRSAVVTFCVYPDSFALYRRLRDYLYARDIEVAARLIPPGAFIRASRHGTASQSQ
jgi:hypothetical protein